MSKLDILVQARDTNSGIVAMITACSYSYCLEVIMMDYPHVGIN